MSYPKRFIITIISLALYGFGCYLSINANLGLAPWDAFNMGFAYAAGISYGNAGVLVGLVILVLDVIMGEPIGCGTILNTLMISKVVDICDYFKLLSPCQSFLSGVAVLLLGQLCIAAASYFYISAAMGCGPRDALMLACGKRFKAVPIGIVRAVLEGGALFVGFLLGAKVGIGTVIAVFSIGFILQGVFAAAKFEARDIRHENCIETVRNIIRNRKSKNYS